MNYGYIFNASPTQQQSSGFNDTVSFDSSGPMTADFTYNMLNAPWLTIVNAGVYRISYAMHVAPGGAGSNPYGLELNGQVIPGSTQLVDVGSGAKEELHVTVLVQAGANAHLTLQNLGHIVNFVSDPSLLIEQVA